VQGQAWIPNGATLKVATGLDRIGPGVAESNETKAILLAGIYLYVLRSGHGIEPGGDGSNLTKAGRIDEEKIV
jgi:hypothetical protein